MEKLSDAEVKTMSLEEKLSYIWDNSQTVVDMLLSRLGISPKNLEKVKKELGKDGFVDRCDTLCVHYGLTGIINEYMNSYRETEDKELKQLIEDDEEKLYKKIQRDLNYMLELRVLFSNDFKKSLDAMTNTYQVIHRKSLINDEAKINKWRLSVGFHRSKYFRTFINLFPNNIDCEISEYISKYTGNKLLASYIEDIDISKLDYEFKEMIETYSYVLSYAFMVMLSPKFINKEQLVLTDEGLVIYRTSNERTVESIEKIRETLNAEFKAVDIRIYREEYLDNDNKIRYKHDITNGEQFDRHNVTADNQLDLIKYYKIQEKKRITTKDLIYESNGELVKAYNKNKLEFNEIYNTLKETGKLV